MKVQIKTPNITASNDREKLQQLQSYLFQMAQQLQWAFDNIDSGSAGVVAPQVNSSYYGRNSAGGKSPAENFADIKALIIKSADIVNAYSDAISKRLEGVYVAKSEFGDYKEQTALILDATSKGITQNYTDIQQVQMNMSYLENTVGDVQTDIGGLQILADNTLQDIYFLENDVLGLQNSMDTVQGDVLRLDVSMAEAQKNVDTVMADVKNLEMMIVDTTAYIKSGLLEESSNGIPIYGLEIGQSSSVDGQTVFDKFARFTADRLSFFDRNDVEVAYISDYHLYITNAHITGSLVLMQQFEVSRGNQSIDFRWIGG